jgi:hypothetical protein
VRRADSSLTGIFDFFTVFDVYIWSGIFIFFALFSLLSTLIHLMELRIKFEIDNLSALSNVKIHSLIMFVKKFFSFCGSLYDLN